MEQRERDKAESGDHHHSPVSLLFEQIEKGISISIGAVLVLATLLLLTTSIALIWTAAREWPGSDSVFLIVDRLLFVLMLVEILHTVRASIQSKQLAVEPFLIVGLIATVRRILVVTLQTSDIASPKHPVPSFDHAMIELGVLGGLTLVLMLSIYLSRQSRAVLETPDDQADA